MPGHARNSHKGKQPHGRRNFKGKPEQEQRVHQEEADYGQYETLSSSDGEYTFRLESTASKVSAPFVSLKVNGISCKFFVDSGASVNIVSFNACRAFGVILQSCDTKVYAFNSCDPLPMKGKF